MVASHLGIPSHIRERHVAPNSIESEPTTMSHFIRPVAVMMKPADTPQIVKATEGPARRNPETDAVSSSTAWKYKGALNRIVFMPTCAKKLLKTRLPRGLLNNMGRGMTARAALDSTLTRTAPVTSAITSDVMTIQCFHGYTLPPRFSPRIRNATDTVSKKDPAMSNPFSPSCKPSP